MIDYILAGLFVVVATLAVGALGCAFKVATLTDDELRAIDELAKPRKDKDQ